MGNERIPQLDDGKDYLTWKKEVEIWKLGTTAKDTQQAPRLVGFMQGKAHEAALQISAEELGSTNGVQKLLEGLDLVFLKDKTQSLFQAIESFEQYSRSPTESIDEYIREFEQRYKKLKELRKNQEAYEDGIKAFKLLHQANLKPEQKRLIRATTAELTYKGMSEALKRTFGDGSGILDKENTNPNLAGAGKSETDIKQETFTFYTKGQSSSGDTDQSGYCSSGSSRRSRMMTTSSSDCEEENVLYVNGGKYKRVDRQRPQREKTYEDRRDKRPNFYQRQRPEKTHEERRDKRPHYQPGSPKKQPKCFICGAPDHIVATCPYNEYQKEDRKSQELTFLTKIDQQSETVSTDIGSFLAETEDKGLLDTGATSTVCGRKWLQDYVGCLPPWRAEQVTIQPCNVFFRFGNGGVVRASKLVKIPVEMFGQRLSIRTHVVDCSIPLLISRETMREFRFVIDICDKKVYAMGGEQPILETQSGHMAISIRRSENLRSRTKTCVSEHKKDHRTQDKAKKHVSYAYYSDSSDSEESSTEDESQISDQLQVPTVNRDSAVTEEQTAPENTPQDPDVSQVLQTENQEPAVSKQTVIPVVLPSSVKVEQSDHVVTEQPTQQKTPKQTWSKVKLGIKTKTYNLKQSDVIRFRSKQSEQWTSALVDSRAGKTTGSYKNCFNLRLAGELDLQIVDLDKQEVEKMLKMEKD